MEVGELAGFPECRAFVFTFESGGRFLFDGSLMRPETWSHVHRNDLTQHCIGSGRLASESGVWSAGSRRPWVGYFDRVCEIAATWAENPGVIGYRGFSPIGQRLAAIQVKPCNGYARIPIKRVNEECGVALEAVEL